jgi:ABC-type polysaccharide/polyol phosphate transport system ATPase subunit
MTNPQPVIRFEGVSKRFVYSTNRPQTILEVLISAFTRTREQQKQTLWAVRDATFDVLPGQSLGIIGRNGSGKSTILKLAAGIIRPTAGRVTINGRLSALLELGAGFHPDLSGQENILLNASILGMSRADVATRYQRIVEFSELKEYINMPVKHYSSGMYMRLGFSVAVHMDPDLLIVDEILAVGDQAFQAKCIDRIFDLKREGVTIVLVSHNLETVRNLCSHLLWVEDGSIVAAGPADEVIDGYLQSQEGWYARRDADGTHMFQRWGSREIELTAVRLLGADGRERDEFYVGEPLTVEMAYEAREPVEEPAFGLGFFRRDGLFISGPDNHAGRLMLGNVEGRGAVRFQMDELPLVPGVYRMSAVIYDKDGVEPYDFHDKAYTFHVVPDGDRVRKGVVEFAGNWEWAPLASSAPQNPSLEVFG